MEEGEGSRCRNHDFLTQLRVNAVRDCRRRFGLLEEDSDPNLGLLDGEYVVPKEPKELIQARKQFQAYLVEHGLEVGPTEAAVEPRTFCTSCVGP
mmetsp:Transcript_473/g.559  ORF Transcript_473/g.559 Transcript_473/m.559 type:complete len:95 (+) Transcript_473:577-861(+)